MSWPKVYLSKSDFLKYQICPSYLWLWKHKRHAVPVDEEEDIKRRLEQGNEVERFARQLFISAILVETHGAHPICRACHLALHIRFTNPDRWRKRKAVINERRLEAGEEIGSNWWDHLINQPIVMLESLSAKELKELQDRDLKLFAELRYYIYSDQKSK